MNVTFNGSMDNLRAYARFNTRRRFRGYRRLQRQQRLWIVRIATSTVFLSPVLLLVGGADLLFNRQIRNGLFPIAVGTLYVVLIVWFLLPQVRRQRQEKKWATLPSLGKPIHAELDEAGFHYIEATAERHVDWIAVVEVEESDSHFFVVDCQPVVYTIPKEAFASPADADAFGRYVRSHMATTTPT